MTSRIAAAVLATLVAGGLVHGQSAPPPTPLSSAVPPPVVTTPAISADAPATIVTGPSCGCDWSCGDGDGDTHVVGPRGRFWAEGEFLYWWMRGSPVPSLVTSGSPTTPPTQVGVLGQQGTINLFGGSQPLNEEPRIGGRVTIGGWIDCEQTLGIEASGLLIGDKKTTFNAGSLAGGQVLARPFFDANFNAQNERLVSFPAVANGTISIQAKTDGLLGGGVLARENLFNGCNWRVDVLGGYRYLRFADRLGISVVQLNLGQTIPPNIPIGSVLNIRDQFDAVNDFHGFDFGLDGEYRAGPWRFKWLTKVAVGENFEATSINGSTTVTFPTGQATRFIGGLLTAQPNIGNLGRDYGTIIPEFGAQIGCQLTRHVRGWVGYTLLFWNDALYAGKQIDQTVNTNLLAPNNPFQPVGPFRPNAVIQSTALWAQGIDVGLEVRY
jgi:hypothetical protein